ncbi:hypothetical protein [Cyclobacterium amurskyense]|uniref:Lipocalin-like domain-containing protein n=1 Tax=Cyclobacterium amurskyense TaxID=320787 RepID=A0A0H4PGS6_9BACT|nr:hypothetical protein [Cyclobacterium amurskyense]AKP53394.1 hypothetical protein CA2015_4036 [Cyclobacterium amurskyense]
MKTFKFTLILFILISGLNSCEEDTIEPHTTLQDLETEKYFDSEIFTESNFKIYGTWELYTVSGGFSGSGHDLNFQYLVIKEYGIYGFVKNNSLLEYGKISPAIQTTNDLRWIVVSEKDKKSNSFFIDSEKYVEFIGNDTLNLYSPCCDRYNYQFKRVK